jgi:hypothetical protein
MAWWENIGTGTAKEAVKEAAADLAPLTDDIVSRFRGMIYESLERFNGAKWEISIVDNKFIVEMKLPPVSPLAVSEGFRG